MTITTTTTTRLSTLRARLEAAFGRAADSDGKARYARPRVVSDDAVAVLPRHPQELEHLRRDGGRRLGSACWGHSGQLRALLAKAAGVELQLGL